MRILVQLPVLLVLVASPALAGDFFAYTQDNGTLAFSDDVARVPERYRPNVARRRSQALTEYARHTEVQRYPKLVGASAEDAGQGRGASVVIEGQPPMMLVNAGQGLQVPVAIGEDVAKVEVRYAYRWSNGRYTPFTIVSQGDRVLAEIERPTGGH